MESSYDRHQSPVEVITKLALVEDFVWKADKSSLETFRDSNEMASAASSELSDAASKSASHFEEFRDVFMALTEEDFNDDESRNHFIASQLQMLEHFRSSASGSSSQSDDDDLEMANFYFAQRHTNGTLVQRNLSRSRSLPQRTGHILRERWAGNFEDDEVGDESEDELYTRLQMDFMRRLGLLDEEFSFVDRRTEQECQVCLDCVRLTVRPCCQKAVCDSCLQQYVETQIVDNGNLRMGCPNPDCQTQVFSDEIRSILRTKPELRDRYDRWIVDLNGDPNRKTCPRCCHITELEPSLVDRKVGKYGLKVACTECQLEWCFPCQSPWHEGISCKKNRAGDTLLKKWAREHVRHGECNAQRCPKCKVFIQRTEGCDHMTCSRCSTEFCYRCGCRRLPALKVFGYPLEDHDLKRSIIGCNSDYKQGKPVQRVFARGALFGAKVVGGAVALPVAVGLAAGAVGLAAGVAAVALPAYGSYRLIRKIREKVRERKHLS